MGMSLCSWNWRRYHGREEIDEACVQALSAHRQSIGLWEVMAGRAYSLGWLAGWDLCHLIY